MITLEEVINELKDQDEGSTETNILIFQALGREPDNIMKDRNCGYHPKAFMWNNYSERLDDAIKFIPEGWILAHFGEEKIESKKQITTIWNTTLEHPKLGFVKTSHIDKVLSIAISALKAMVVSR